MSRADIWQSNIKFGARSLESSHNREYFNRKVFVLFVLLGVITAVASLAALIAIYTLESANRRSAQIRYQQSSLDAVYLDLREAESAQRGYVLTGNTSYLTPYHEALERRDRRLSDLDTFEAGVIPMPEIKTFKELTRQKWTELEDTVNLAQSGSNNEAQALVNAGRGQEVMVQIRDQRTKITTQFAKVLIEQRIESRRLGNISFYGGIISELLIFILLPLAYYFFKKALDSQRALDTAKDEFVSLASHQLRTPATGIKSILSMVIAGDFGPLNQKQTRYLGLALESNEREIKIIEELLNVAKADAGRLVLHQNDVDITALTNTIISEQAAAIANKNITVEVNDLDAPVVILADQDKLYMAIGNILDNARKYTPENGHIAVRLIKKRLHVMIEISDTGLGIDEAEISRVFDRFHRAAGVLSGAVEGTGLGLYLARRIMELHNGTIDVVSKKGDGSKFTMTLPTRRT